MTWRKFQKTAIQEMRDYVPGEDLFHQCIAINDVDKPPKTGGMIARNADNHEDKWYISPEFMEKNYKEVGDTHEGKDAG